MAVHLTFLTEAVDTQSLFAAGRAALDARGWQTLITDASAVSGANFDAVWALESEIDKFAIELKGAEWRHIPSASPALQLSLRRMLRNAQAKGAHCGVYGSLDEAIGAGVIPLDEAAVYPFRNAWGHLSEEEGRLTVVLASMAGDLDLAILMDAAVERLQSHAQPCLVLHIPAGARQLSSSFLLEQATRIHAFGGGIALIADEAGILTPAQIPECPKGILHLAPSLSDALEHLALFSLDRFRLHRLVA